VSITSVVSQIYVSNENRSKTIFSVIKTVSISKVKRFILIKGHTHIAEVYGREVFRQSGVLS
jgi:hypothetical protein